MNLATFHLPALSYKHKPAARIFSPIVVTRLIQASQVGETLSGERAQAVRSAVAFAMKVHPELFKKEKP